MDNKLKGGLADGMTISDIAKRHKTSLELANDAWKTGTRVEMEHVNDVKVASEIALDHLYEDIFYYEKLKSIEENLSNRLKNRINEA